MDTIKEWTKSGIIAIIILGFLLHSVYSWTDSLNIIGLFAPVNESVWEHLKLGYWSVVLFSIAEYSHIRDRVNNYFVAKIIGVVVLELMIIIIYYSYNLISNKNILLIDISSYIIGTVFCQYIAYLLFRVKSLSLTFNRISLALFIALGILFGVTTYHPPHIGLFKDNHTKTFGIHKER